MSDDYKLPDLPSDEELGIDGLSEDDLVDDDGAEAPRTPASAEPPAAAPPPKPPREPRAPAAPAGPPPPAWRGPLTLLVLLAFVWISRPGQTMPSPRAANAPDTVFASARALTELVEIARAPHPPGSPEHARVREVLLERLRELGTEPEVHTATVLRGEGDEVAGATVRNLVARIPGTASTGAVVLTAHYDGRTLAPGAGDDATGVVTILETLRALRAGAPLRNDLIVLITDAEELGLLGARAFVDGHRWMDDVRLVISVEMRGGGGPSVMFETNADNGWIMERLDAVDPHPLANSVSMDIYRRMPRDTDFTPFRQAGVQGLNFAAIGRAHVYHQAYDTPENLEEATLQHHGARVLAVVRELGERDLAEVDAPSHAFVTLPFLGLLTWPLGWALPLTGALAGLLVVAGVVTVVRGGGWRGIAGGAGLGLLAAAVVGAAGHGLFVWARGRHPEYGALMGSAFHVEGWYVAALAALALAVVGGALATLRTRVHRGALFLGAMLPAALAAVVAGFAAPEAAPNLQGPVAAGLLAVLVVSLAGPRRDGGWVAWGVGLLLALPVLGFLVVFLELVWVAMSFSLAAVLGVVTVVTLLLLSPALDGLNAPNRWWAPVVSLGACALFVALGARTATPSADRPAPSTLVYVQDQGGPGAPVQALWATRGDAGVGWAREATAAALDTEQSFEGLRLGGAPWLVSAAQAMTLPPPRAVVTGDTVVEGRRRLTLAVDPGLGAESVGFGVSAPARLLALGETPLGAAGAGVARVWHHGAPVDSLFVLTVVQDPGLATLDLTVLQHHQRPWEITGEEPWARPADLAPNVMNQSDRAVIRSQLRLLLDGSGDTGAGAAGGADAGETVPAAAADTAAVTPPDTGMVAAPDTASGGRGAAPVPPSTGSPHGPT